jgi:2-hydroxychromene-2-carboxylate isomerase
VLELLSPVEEEVSKITKQKGVASSTPSPLKRWFLSRLMTRVISEASQEKARKRREIRRRSQGRKHVVEYFHQVDDGYSHLAIQLLERLKSQYDVDLVIHLVPTLEDANSPEPVLLQEMSRRDSAAIAPYYNLQFPEADAQPSGQLQKLATAILCRLDPNQFARAGVSISDRLWRSDEAGMNALASTYGSASEPECAARIAAGAERRKTLKHYSGAMFWYEGEWYWGVDRLYLLEARLKALGALNDDSRGPIAPRPVIASAYMPDARNLILEYYPSLRSPYTAVSWEPTLKFARSTGLELVVRPVLPMVMRGVPATFEKAFYVFKDAAREARALKIDFGDFYDPIGEPITRGYSLFVWAREQGKGNALLGSFLKAAFVKGINTTTLSGLEKVAVMAGLDWQKARKHLADDTWQEELEANRLAMYGFGSWGVPSYRLLDRDRKEIVSVWGQDRLWLISKKLEDHAQ